MTSIAAEAWLQDETLQRILALLNGEGGEARIVGGAVRNSLMKRPVTDIDIATTLRPDQVLARARDGDVKAVPTGIDHGTVTLVSGGRPFEVTTLRQDLETDGRHARVAFGTDWQADAERRDLTINALYATATGEVIDLVGGVADIESRTIRFIGDAATRIDEDYLRILRFFRFFAFYGAGRPDAQGLKASAAARSKLKTLSVERIWSEMKKLLSAPDPGRALLWMRQAGVLTEIFPETEKWGIDALPGLIAAEAALNWPVDPMLRLAAIVPPDAARLEALSERLKLSRAEAADLKDFAQAPDIPQDINASKLDRLLYVAGSRGLSMRLRLAAASARSKSEQDASHLEQTGRLLALVRRAEDWKKPKLPVSGDDVKAAGIKDGRDVGSILKLLESEWVQEGFSLDRAALLERLHALAQKN